MKDMLQGKRFLGEVGMSLVLALALCGTTFGQQAGQEIAVSGRVTSQAGGAPIQGGTVRIRGTSTSTVTDAGGKDSLTAPSDGALVFGLPVYRGVVRSMGGR